MKAISSDYERKPVIKAFSLKPDEEWKSFISLIVEENKGRSVSILIKRLKLAEDLAQLYSTGYLHLYRKYLSSKNQYEKLEIRRGSNAAVSLFKKPIQRDQKLLFRFLYFQQITGEEKVCPKTEARDKVRDIQRSNSIKRHSKASKESYRNIPQCLEYWVLRGFSLEEANEKRNEFNSVHSLSYKNFVEKYGEKEGIDRMLEINSKRKKTILEKYGVTVFGCPTSKKSIKFFIPVYKYCRKLGLKPEDIFWGISGSKEWAMYDSGRNYFYDFTIKPLKLIFEYNGCYWHAREDLEWKRKDITKEQSLEYDEKKKEVMVRRGFNLFTIWEDRDKVSELQKVKNIIKEEYDKFRTRVSD